MMVPVIVVVASLLLKATIPSVTDATVIAGVDAIDELNAVYPLVTKPPDVPSLTRATPRAAKLTTRKLMVMRVTQSGMPVKSIDDPLAVCAVADVNGCDNIVGVTVAELPVTTAVPVIAGTVSVYVDAVLGVSSVTEPPPDEFKRKGITSFPLAGREDHSRKVGALMSDAPRL
jgi:hypothetical protein